MTLLCAVITLQADPCADVIAAQAACASQRAGADLIELRLDEAFSADASTYASTDVGAGVIGRTAERIERIVRDAPLPAVVTCRPTWEGGACGASEQARLTLFARLARSAYPPTYLDVELAAINHDARWEGFIESHAERDGAGDAQPRIVLSSHDFLARPADLLRRITAMRATSAAVIKIAFRARSVRDNLELFDLLRERDRPMIALAMGKEGELSRVLAPKFGAFAVYAPAPGMPTSAPGQRSIADLLHIYRFRDVGPATRVFGVIGDPVAQSLSPQVHNAAFGRADFDGVYVPLRVERSWESFKASLASLVDFGALDFTGASITIPHKTHALRFARERAEAGEPWIVDDWGARVGAVNTLARNSDGSWLATNTDAPAIASCLRAALGDHVRAGLTAAILGAGGVARAAVAACAALGIAVCVHARREEQARSLATDLCESCASDGAEDAPEIAVAPWDGNPAGADVVINCTPIGMATGAAPDESPIQADALDALPREAVVFDTVYNPLHTPLLVQAAARGLRVIDGLELFTRQAALQSALWTGADVDTQFFRKAAAQALDDVR